MLLGNPIKTKAKDTAGMLTAALSAVDQARQLSLPNSANSA